jgi:alpha-mannosidase
MKIISSNAVVSSVKIAEDNESGLLLRVYETEGKPGKVEIIFDKTPVEVGFVDINEIPMTGEAAIDGNTVKFRIEPYNIDSLLVEF